MTEETKKQEETENLNTKNEIIADDSVTESEGNIEQEGTIANLSIEELINNQGLRKTIIKNSYQLALNNSFELNSKKIFNYLKNHLESNKKKIDYDTL